MPYPWSSWIGDRGPYAKGIRPKKTQEQVEWLWPLFCDLCRLSDRVNKRKRQYPTIAAAVRAAVVIMREILAPKMKKRYKNYP